MRESLSVQLDTVATFDIVYPCLLVYYTVPYDFVCVSGIPIIIMVI